MTQILHLVVIAAMAPKLIIYNQNIRSLEIFYVIKIELQIFKYFSLYPFLKYANNSPGN